MISAFFRSERACVFSPARERRDCHCINRKKTIRATNYYYYDYYYDCYYYYCCYYCYHYCY